MAELGNLGRDEFVVVMLCKWGTKWFVSGHNCVLKGFKSFDSGD